MNRLKTVRVDVIFGVIGRPRFEDISGVQERLQAVRQQRLTRNLVRRIKEKGGDGTSMIF